MGKSPPSFSEIGKKAKDLLFKDYFYDSKVTISSKTESGVKFSSCSLKKGEEFSSDAKAEFDITKNVEAEVKIDTKNKIHVKADVEDLAPGLKLTLSGVVPDPKATKADIKYKQDLLYLTASSGLVAQPTVEGTVSTGAHGVVAGAEVGYDTATNATTKYNFGVAYSESDYSVALLVADKLDTVKASYYQKLQGGNAALAVELAHKVSKKDTTFTAGSTYKIDSLTAAKFRVNSRGVVAALMEHEFRPKSTVIFSAEVDSKALDKSSKLGVAVSMKV